MSDKVIVMTLFRRPDYTRQVLEALNRCDGVQDYHVSLHVEPTCQEVRRLARDFDHPNKQMVRNARQLGCTENTYAALDYGFSCSDFVILLEDDTVPAQDCLRYFEWARERFADDKRVFTVSAYNKTLTLPPPEQHFAAGRVAWFNCWGWGTWRDRWEEMKVGWGFGQYDSWDLIVNRLRGDREQIAPDLARCQNIGAEGGVHCPGPQWHRENQFNELGAWSLKLGRGRYWLRSPDGTEETSDDTISGAEPAGHRPGPVGPGGVVG